MGEINSRLVCEINGSVNSRLWIQPDTVAQEIQFGRELVMPGMNRSKFIIIIFQDAEETCAKTDRP